MEGGSPQKMVNRRFQSPKGEGRGSGLIPAASGTSDQADRPASVLTISSVNWAIGVLSTF